MKAPKKTPTGDYETGYCRPPKAHQFTAENNPRKKARVSRASDDERFDPAGFFAKSVAITRNGEEQRVSKFEVLIRGYVKAALKENKFKAMQYLLKAAEEHGLLQEAPEPMMRGGVLVVPGRLTPKAWDEIFRPKGPSTNSDEKAKAKSNDSKRDK